MATTEERLAALEARMAAWIDQQPTNYYTHQYSGEEIDNAVARALPNGAIDQAAGTFVRPNLLDNAYFGNPVDQKKGMLQLAGTMLYSDAACTQALFQSTKTTSIVKVSDIAAHPSDDSTVYVKLADCVRGYTGNWIYSFDRWKISPSSIVSVSGGGLSVIADFQQAILSTALILGQKYTMSALSTDGRLGQLTFTLQQDIAINQGFGFGYFVVYRDVDQYWFRLYGTDEATYLAIKLEIGPTQTLAHREGDKWVLNEVPEYGEQLRRCQWYSNVLPGIYWLPQNADGTNRLTIPIPDMRTIPAVTYEPADGSTGTLYYDANLAQKNSIQFYATGVTGICGVKNIRISADL